MTSTTTSLQKNQHLRANAAYRFWKEKENNCRILTRRSPRWKTVGVIRVILSSHFLIQTNQTNNSETGKIRIDQRNFFTREIYINQIGTQKISMQSIYSAFLNKNSKEHVQILTCKQAYQIILSTSKFNLIITTWLNAISKF